MPRKRARKWKKSSVDEDTKKKTLNIMEKVAYSNKGQISLLRTSSGVLKSRLMVPMIQDGLVTIKGSSSSSKTATNHNDVIGLDCEMVGTGLKGKNSALGRCSIVDYDCEVIYDSYVKPDNPITDYRTRWSGIRPRHIKDAKPFAQAFKEIKTILSNKIVVGHDVENDFKAIKIDHPLHLVRDTSHLNVLQTDDKPSLRKLAKVLFNLDIQRGPHSSIEDAKATLRIYKLFEKPWEDGQRTISFKDFFPSSSSLLEVPAVPSPPS